MSIVLSDVHLDEVSFVSPVKLVCCLTLFVGSSTLALSAVVRDEWNSGTSVLTIIVTVQAPLLIGCCGMKRRSLIYLADLPVDHSFISLSEVVARPSTTALNTREYIVQH